MTKYYYDPQEIEARAIACGVSAQCTDIESKAKQYQDLVLQELRKNLVLLASTEQINQEQIPFGIDQIRKKLGRYGKPQKYWWNWLHQNFPIVEIVKKGNSHQKVLSMVKMKIPLEILLASNDIQEIIDSIYKDFDPDSEVHPVKIDLRSLKNYISSSEAVNSTNPTLQENLKKARLILAIAKHLDGVLPQIANHSMFGRTYYQGLNLQNCHKTVREAALGHCYSIDINSSVFNWKYAMVPFREELSYTRELIQDRNRIRKYLAQLVFGNTKEYSIKTVKQVLTAISFGARAESNCWFRNPNGDNPAFIQGAISTIITSKENRKQLFNDPWMKQFMAEQERINLYIYKELMELVNQGEIPETHLNQLRTERGRISKSKIIAWAYQHHERGIMDKMLEYCNSEVLLQVHDGVYVKHKPDLASMRTVLREEWPLADIDVKEIHRYTYENIVDIEEHKQRIRQEETSSKTKSTPKTRTVFDDQQLSNPHSEPDWIQLQELRLKEHLLQERPDFIQKLIRRTP